MDNRDVSVTAILEGVDYLKSQFVATLDEQAESAIGVYQQMMGQGTLSSGNIDTITQEIRGRIAAIQSNFNTLAVDLRRQLTESADVIAQGTKNIESSL